MPRGRFHSRKFSKDPKIWSLPDDSHRLLYAMIIDWLDREGRIEGDANIIKGQVAPLAKDWTVEKVEQMLQTISKVTKPNGLGLLNFYTVNGIRYIWYSGFHSEQVGLQKDHEAPSEIPPPPSSLTRLLKTARVKPKTITSSLDSRLAEAVKVYEEAFGKMITPQVYERLKDIVDNYTEDEYKKAVDEAKSHNARSPINYMETCLETWHREAEPVETGDGMEGFEK